jgi:hypothetical protein
VNAGGNWLNTQPIAGLCGIPRIFEWTKERQAKDSLPQYTVEAGGPDGHVLYADRASGDIFISTNCAHGFQGTTYGSDGKPNGNVPLDDSLSYPVPHLLLRSADYGRTWNLIGQSTAGTWRANMTSSADGIHLVLGWSSIVFVPRPFSSVVNLDASLKATIPNESGGDLPKGDTTRGRLFFIAGSPSLAATGDGKLVVSRPAWCNSNRLIWKALVQSGTGTSTQFQDLATTWPGSLDNPPTDCPAATAAPQDQDYFALLIEAPLHTKLDPLWIWIARNGNALEPKGGIPHHATGRGLAAMGPMSREVNGTAHNSNWNGSSFFGDYFTGTSFLVGRDLYYVFGWEENGVLHFSTVAYGPIEDSIGRLFFFNAADRSGAVGHIAGDGSLQTDGQQGAGRSGPGPMLSASGTDACSSTIRATAPVP